MTAGRYQWKVKILKAPLPGTDLDASGAPKKGAQKDYGIYKSFWAYKRHLRGAERTDGHTETANVEVEFETFYRRDIDEKDVLEHDGKQYEILEIAEVGYKDRIKIRTMAKK